MAILSTVATWLMYICENLPQRVECEATRSAMRNCRSNRPKMLFRGTTVLSRHVSMDGVHEAQISVSGRYELGTTMTIVPSLLACNDFDPKKTCFSFVCLGAISRVHGLEKVSMHNAFVIAERDSD
jgi:hypothetical protein